jgi:very-short-patch-repair endonuclease
MSGKRLPHRELVELAQEAVLSRAQLRTHGWDRQAIARQVAADRWSLHGDQTVALHTAPLSDAADRWRAIWEVGNDVAALDGVTALQVAGLKGYDDDRIHVSVKHTARVVEPSGVKLHKVIRRVPEELVGAGIPRTRPAFAAVRAAHWAVSDRQAALLLAMPVQQRLVTGAALVDAVRQIRGRNRRAFIKTVAHDVADGAQSLGELDFAKLCRARDLPHPSRQAVRQGARGKVYLDVLWEDIGLAVEIDGSQHTWGLALTDDHFRQNDLVISGEPVLRMTLMGLRLQPDVFMDQVCRAHAVLRSRAA